MHLTMSIKRVLTGEEYLALPRSPQRFLIEPLLPESGALLVYGAPKTGKSYAVLQMLTCLSSGVPWMGFPTHVPKGPIVYIQLDTPRGTWSSRVAKLVKAGHPVDLLHQADRETLGTFPFDILDPSHFYLLKDALAEVNPSVVVFDTLRECHSGDSNDDTAMRNVVGELVKVSHPAALVLVHHDRKPNHDRPADLMNDARGSQYLTGRMDGIIRFTKQHIYYGGRDIEEGSIEAERDDEGLWVPVRSDIDLAMEKVLADPTTGSVRAKAKLMAEMTGKSDSACRAALRRAMLK